MGYMSDGHFEKGFIYNGGFDRENSYWRVLYQSGSTINTKVSN